MAVIMNCSDCEDLDLNVNSSLQLLNDSMWTLHVSVTTSALTATVYMIILLLALIFNPLIMVFIIRDKKINQPSFVFLFCFLVIDFLEAFASIPFYLATHFLHGWRFGDTDAERQAVCDLVGFFLSVFLSVSAYILGIIAFDRFFYIVCAFKYKRYMKPWVAWVMVLGICSLPVLVSALPLFGFGYFDFNQDFGACLFRWRGETAYVILFSSVAFFPVVLVFVFTIITCCYVHRFIGGATKARAKFTMRRDSKLEERAKQSTLTQIFGLLLVTQIVCFVPAFLTAFIGAGSSFYDIPKQLFRINFILVLSNAAINPIIQSLVWKKLRNKLCFCLRWNCCKCQKQQGGISNIVAPISYLPNFTVSSGKSDVVSNGKVNMNGSMHELKDFNYSVKVTNDDGSHTMVQVTETVV